jgi:hypothetical protein
MYSKVGVSFFIQDFLQFTRNITFSKKSYVDIVSQIIYPHGHPNLRFSVSEALATTIMYIPMTVPTLGGSGSGGGGGGALVVWGAAAAFTWRKSDVKIN